MRLALSAGLYALTLAVAVPSLANASAISLPGGMLSVSSIDLGTSFTYSGTLTSADTLGFTQTGNPCLQSGGVYCTNGAGVLVVAGNGAGVGQSSTNPDNSTTFGSLLLTISGVGTEQLFGTDAANGLGSASPPTSLTLAATSLNALGFGIFSVTDPTLTFSVSDTMRSDNSGAFTLTQSPVPLPAAAPMFGAALLALGAVGYSMKRKQTAA